MTTVADIVVVSVKEIKKMKPLPFLQDVAEGKTVEHKTDE